MLEELKNTLNRTRTENGAFTYRTTGNDCLDLFATIGGLREASDDVIITKFMRAYSENPDMAMKILFFARDIRSGLGERKIFRTIIKYMASQQNSSIKKNIKYIPEYGRYDDLLSLMNTPYQEDMIKLVKLQLYKDVEATKLGKKEVSLLAKWLPSVNASNKETVHMAKRIARLFNMNDKEYRQILSMLRKKIDILENYLREKDYTFDYEKQPSKASLKYRKAFMRNDEERYRQYLIDVSSGKAKINTATLYPYDIVNKCFERNIDENETLSLDTMWRNLPTYEMDDDSIVVIDGSGSMYMATNPSPACVAVSLGIYFAQHNKGEFRNHFITFSQNPKLVEIKGRNIVEQTRYCASYNEVANTNIKAVFELILKTATINRMRQSDLPSTIYIVSDMEFDYCVDNSDITNFEYAKKMYENAGYKLPNVVFWNVSSRNEQQPVRANDMGVALVSGCNPKLFSMVISGNLSPYEYMLEIVNSERYNVIKA